MKCFRRYLCVLSCLVLLFSICCVPVSAESVDTSSYNVIVKQIYANSSNGPFYSRGRTTIDFIGSFSVNVEDNDNAVLGGYTEHEFHFLNSDNSLLFKSGSPVSFTVQNLRVRYSSGGADNYFPHEYDFYLQYTDGTVSAVLSSIDMVQNINENKHDFNLTFTPDKDVDKIVIRERFVYSYIQGWWDTSAVTGAGVRYAPYTANFYYSSDTPLTFVVSQDSKTESLLGGILDSLTSGLANVFQAIIDLPAKIWEFIENGLKSLFVPDEDYIAGYKDKWEQLLADRLGAVYQVVQITFGAWEDIGTADERNSVSVPNVTIPLPDDNSFSFGGYDVQIVPDGFQGIVETLKLIVGIACTFLFVNGLRKRYDEVMGVEK